MAHGVCSGQSCGRGITIFSSDVPEAGICQEASFAVSISLADVCPQDQLRDLAKKSAPEILDFLSAGHIVQVHLIKTIADGMTIQASWEPSSIEGVEAWLTVTTTQIYTGKRYSKHTVTRGSTKEQHRWLKAPRRWWSHLFCISITCSVLEKKKKYIYIYALCISLHHFAMGPYAATISKSLCKKQCARAAQDHYREDGESRILTGILRPL